MMTHTQILTIVLALMPTMLAASKKSSTLG
jgi:hypothetical protein